MPKKTPLNQSHKEIGAKMVPFAGWEMPVSYKSIIEEHNAVRNSVGIFDIGHMGLIKIEGEDALALIQKVATNDASRLEVNQCQYSILCNNKGGTIDDILVYHLPMQYLIVSNASNTEKVLAWLKKQSEGLKHATVEPYENYCMLSVQGPAAEKTASKVLDLSLSNLKHNHLLWWKDIIISRTGYTGEDGLELIVANGETEKIWNMFIKGGAQPCGLGARDTLRLEAGLPLYGHEYDEETSPLEVGYGWAVKLDKDNFIGKPVLLKQKEKGTNKKLVGIEVKGRMIIRNGGLIFDASGDREIGKVTSGTFSPTLKKPIALAYLAAKEASPGNSVKALVRGTKLPAKLVAKTFYKR
ncbi:MAG: glycine cleavage system aminomethyltransferase GcvT [Candidatus Margulisiibacteriota bacterium]|nr:glycine cleavage system aminomethyltransferase GcvT [Candidatus Margulisiibacteriota bacterium]